MLIQSAEANARVPADRFELDGGLPHRAAELGLAAGPAEEHHQPAGDELGYGFGGIIDPLIA